MGIRISRDAGLAISLFLILTVVLFINYAREQRPAEPPLSASSTARDGANALARWLAALGYEVNTQVEGTYAVPEATDLMLLLEPTELIADDQWRILDEWVEAGGTLLIAGDRYLYNSWADHYDFQRIWAGSAPSVTLQIAHPLWVSPPLTNVPTLPYVGGLVSERADILVHAVADGQPVIVSFAQGQGQVILSTSSFLFSNRGLQSAGAPEVVLNLLTLAGAPGRVWFDEWHHGLRNDDAVATGPVRGIGNWLRQTMPGRAILFALAVIFLALVLQGRNFGRPVPLPRQLARRTPLEYVTAIANLNRRAGHRAAVLQDYHMRLKRALGRRYRLDPRLPDEEFVARLADYDSAVDQAALRALLQRSARVQVNEAEMVALAAEAAKWASERERAG